MNSNPLQELMRELVADQPPMRHDPSDDLARARRSLSRRRAASGAGITAAAAAVTVLAWPGGTTSTTTAVTSQPTSATVLQRCETLGSPVMDNHWADGNRILTSASATGGVRAVVVSADGKRWADCRLREGDRVPGRFATYPITGDRPDPTAEHSNGETGPQEGAFSLLERFPPDVAQVRIQFDNGDEYAAKAVDGFVVFQLDDIDHRSDPKHMRLYDTDGQLLAGPENAPGDADLPTEYRTLVPEHPIAEVERSDGW